MLLMQNALAQAPSRQVLTNTMTLKETVRRVLEHNENVQMRALDVEISRRTLNAERGIYEPQVVSSVETLSNKRLNTVQQRSSLLGAREFNERNNIYNGGLEFLAPTGAKINTGVTLRDLNNNLQQSAFGGPNIDSEYEVFMGTSITQPLLKNFGRLATEVRIRLAAIASDLAFQEYRRQLMLTVAKAESSYWDLYLTQEQERLSQESVAVASAILSDNQNRVQLGRAAELEVLQAQAGVSLRQARFNDAKLKRLQSNTLLTTLFSESGAQTSTFLQATEEPVMRDPALTAGENYELAFSLNPDYLSRRKQAQQENLRLAYAKNQRLPQLDLRASYGLNGLDTSPSGAWDVISHGGYPTWSVGFQMRLPITGGVKERNELEAAKLGKQKALIGLKEIEVQIFNALEATLYKVRSQRENVENYQGVVDFHERLLTSYRERLDLGRLDTRTVLETEEKVFEAKLAVVDSLVQYQKALLELELVSGALLQTRGLDMTKAELHVRTAALAKDRQWSFGALEKYAREVERSDFSDNTIATRNSQQQETLTPQAEERARQILRQKLQEAP
jgi:outer membrane protein TolC